MSTMSTIRLPDELAHWIGEQARDTRRSRGSLVKEAPEKAKQAEARHFLKLAGGISDSADLSQRQGFSGA
jgi:predicted transcriptional regulator